jgi:hypothetical protein
VPAMLLIYVLNHAHTEYIKCVGEEKLEVTFSAPFHFHFSHSAFFLVRYVSSTWKRKL